MKIAQIVYTGFGGLGSVAFSLIEADTRQQHDWIVGFIGDIGIDSSYPKRCAANAVAWKEFRTIRGRPFRAWWRLMSWLRAEQPDAVILHSINSILPCRWHSWRSKTPLIAVEHTPNALKPRSTRLASVLSMLLADRVVLLTREYETELASSFGVLFQPRKVTIIPNGIDTSVFRPSSTLATGRSSTFRLGMAARFSFSKKQDLLVRMMVELLRKRPEVEWSLELAGDGEEFDNVRELIGALGLDEQVKLVGLLDEAAIGGWLRGLDTYVHASAGETLSTSLLQAMATGLPIVASEVPGISNLLGGNKRLGILVSDDPAKWADEIAALYDSPETRRALGMNGRQECLARFGNQAMLQAYIDLLLQGS